MSTSNTLLAPHAAVLATVASLATANQPNRFKLEGLLGAVAAMKLSPTHATEMVDGLAAEKTRLGRLDGSYVGIMTRAIQETINVVEANHPPATDGASEGETKIDPSIAASGPKGNGAEPVVGQTI